MARDVASKRRAGSSKADAGLGLACPISHRQSSVCPFLFAQPHTSRAVRAPSRVPNLTQAEQCVPLPVGPISHKQSSASPFPCGHHAIKWTQSIRLPVQSGGRRVFGGHVIRRVRPPAPLYVGIACGTASLPIHV